MKKKNILFTLILIAAFLLPGCRGPQADPGKPLVRVVTEVTLSLDDLTYSYSSPDSMEAVLAYLRNLSPMGKADRTPTTGSTYRICLIYSDGSKEEYLQRDGCFRDRDGTWKMIGENDMLNLSKLFHLLEPDPSIPAV